jgi:CBS domain containing-hemolysin-like protein
VWSNQPKASLHDGHTQVAGSRWLRVEVGASIRVCLAARRHPDSAVGDVWRIASHPPRSNLDCPSPLLPEFLTAPGNAQLGGDALLLLLYVLTALLFSFLCSVAEASLLSISPAYIAGLRAERPARAALLKKLREDQLDRSLAAILTVNTVAHTVGAIGAGSKATAVFGDAWFGLFSAVMTLLILFVSEIVPKTLGAVYWRQLTGPVSSYINILIKTTYPVIVISEMLTQWISQGRKSDKFNREEFVAMAGIGKELGHLSERESKIIDNLFRLKSVDASAIMTPRNVVAALQQDLSVTAALKANEMPFSRLPIYDSALDGIVGFVLREDLLIAQGAGRGETRVLEFRRDITAVLSSTSLSSLLETLLHRRQHIAMVVGEYGETQGLVTLEDVMETLLGIEILDEGDKIEDMRLLARQIWTKRAKNRSKPRGRPSGR